MRSGVVDFAEERDHHARQSGEQSDLASHSNTKNWDALLTDAVRKGHKENGKAPTDLDPHWTYGSWHVIDIEHPLAGFLPVVSRIAGTGPQPLSGDTTTVKQVGRTFGPSQRFTMDWSDIDGSTEDIGSRREQRPLQLMLSAISGTTITAERHSPSLHPRAAVAAPNQAHAPPAAPP